MSADEWPAALCGGQIPFFIQDADGRQHSGPCCFAALVPGSFNPPHRGHFGLAIAAAQFTGGAVAFELSIVNADKLPLTHDELLQRLAAFVGQWPVVASRAPTFVEKARLWPNTLFVVGCDTAERLLDARYYASRDAALAEIRDLGCRFLVAGRVDAAGTFRGLCDLAVPPAFADLFVDLPEAAFRADVSSTALRNARQADGGSVGQSS